MKDLTVEKVKTALNAILQERVANGEIMPSKICVWEGEDYRDSGKKLYFARRVMDHDSERAVWKLECQFLEDLFAHAKKLIRKRAVEDQGPCYPNPTKEKVEFTNYEALETRVLTALHEGGGRMTLKCSGVYNPYARFAVLIPEELAPAAKPGEKQETRPAFIGSYAKCEGFIYGSRRYVRLEDVGIIERATKDHEILYAIEGLYFKTFEDKKQALERIKEILASEETVYHVLLNNRSDRIVFTGSEHECNIFKRGRDTVFGNIAAAVIRASGKKERLEKYLTFALRRPGSCCPSAETLIKIGENGHA